MKKFRSITYKGEAHWPQMIFGRVFGIEPHEHSVWLDVKDTWLLNVGNSQIERA